MCADNILISIANRPSALDLDRNSCRNQWVLTIFCKNTPRRTNGTFDRLLGGDKILPNSGSRGRPQRVPAQVFRSKLHRYFWMNDLNIHVLTCYLNKT
jgi:hypothetical protein